MASTVEVQHQEPEGRGAGGGKRHGCSAARGPIIPGCRGASPTRHRPSPALTRPHSPQRETHTHTCSCSIQIPTTTSRLQGTLLRTSAFLSTKLDPHTNLTKHLFCYFKRCLFGQPRVVVGTPRDMLQARLTMRPVLWKTGSNYTTANSSKSRPA